MLWECATGFVMFTWVFTDFNGILKISSVTHSLFSSILCSFQEFTNSLLYFDFLISSFSLWWSEKLHGLISAFFFLSWCGCFMLYHMDEPGEICMYNWNNIYIRCLWDGILCIYLFCLFVQLLAWDVLLPWWISVSLICLLM